MCNAWNHSPSCTCGWGGTGHAGRRSGNASFASYSRGNSSFYGSGYPYGIPSIGDSIESYTIPNARCPECGEIVFYYWNSNGSSVFFDSLGLPWAKHPCTDNGPARSSSSKYTPQPIESHEQPVSSLKAKTSAPKITGTFIKVRSTNLLKDGVVTFFYENLTTKEHQTVYFHPPQEDEFSIHFQSIVFCFIKPTENYIELSFLSKSGWRFKFKAFKHRKDALKSDGNCLEKKFVTDLGQKTIKSRPTKRKRTKNKKISPPKKPIKSASKKKPKSSKSKPPKNNMMQIAFEKAKNNSIDKKATE